MGLTEIILTAIALSMDAAAAGMCDGTVEPDMKAKKILLIAVFFGVAQGLMPLIGYYAGSVFSDFMAKVAPYVALILLGFIGGKMIYEALKKDEECGCPTGIGGIAVQAVATSIDALAVGISLLALNTAGTLSVNHMLCFGIFTVATFVLTAIATLIGKKFGRVLADKAELVGGIILVAIGLKIFIEGVFF